MKKVIIYGGAFNPPHVGHAIVIETAIRLFPADEIWLMPSGDRRDKKIGVSSKHRINMIKLMVRDIFKNRPIPIKISSLELERVKLTTTYETKIELEKTYPRHRFYFLIGSDIIDDIKSRWVNGKKLFESSNFLVFEKSSFPVSKNIGGKVTILSRSIEVNVTSTFIRKLIREGRSGLPYLTPSVAAYIKKHRLYKNKK